MYKSVTTNTIIFFITIVAIEATVAVPMLNIFLITKDLSSSTLLILIVTSLLSIFSWFYRTALQKITDKITSFLLHFSTAQWASITIGLGITFRLLWCLTLPSPPLSDSASYIELAQLIAQNKPYYIADTWAYWPPGYPLYLSVFLTMGLTPSKTIVITNILEYLAATAIIYRIGYKIGGIPVARWCTSLLSLWPSLIAAAGIAQKEQLLIPVLLGIFYISYSSEDYQSPLIMYILRGIILGCGCLIQPSLTLLILGIFIIDILLQINLSYALRSTLITFTAAALIVLPWTTRNTLHFNSFVLISTNGGDNFYRSNNQLATGGYTEHGYKTYGHATELEKDKLGKKWALEWIRENPLEFTKLVIWKQILFLGDDANGIYETLRRARNINGPTYAIPKLAAQGLWWLIWTLISLKILTNASAISASKRLLLASTAVPFLYLWAIHSVFESSGKYHVPAIGLVFIVFSFLVTLDNKNKKPSNW